MTESVFNRREFIALASFALSVPTISSAFGETSGEVQCLIYDAQGSCCRRRRWNAFTFATPSCGRSRCHLKLILEEYASLHLPISPSEFPCLLLCLVSGRCLSTLTTVVKAIRLDHSAERTRWC